MAGAEVTDQRDDPHWNPCQAEQLHEVPVQISLRLLAIDQHEVAAEFPNDLAHPIGADQISEPMPLVGMFRNVDACPAERFLDRPRLIGADQPVDGIHQIGQQIGCIAHGPDLADLFQSN